jgi:hypothetical protein
MGPTRAAGPFGVPVFAIVFTIILFGCAQAIKPNNCYKRAFCADRTDGLYCENNTTLTECYRHNRYTSTKCALCETKPDGMGQCTCPDCVPGRWASCDASGKCKCLNGTLIANLIHSLENFKKKETQKPHEKRSVFRVVLRLGFPLHTFAKINSIVMVGF